MNLLKSPEFGKDTALQLIKGLDDAQAKWKTFDKWVEAQVAKSAKTTKGCVIIALIIEASDLTVNADDMESKKVKAICRDFRKDTVDKVLEALTKEERQLIDKKFASIRSSISQAYQADKAPESGDPPKTRKPGLSGKTFEKIKKQLPPYLNSLSDDDLEAFWQIVNSAYTARKVEVQEHKKAS